MSLRQCCTYRKRGRETERERERERENERENTVRKGDSSAVGRFRIILPLPVTLLRR
jgi:hypothetical protein